MLIRVIKRLIEYNQILEIIKTESVSWHESES